MKKILATGILALTVSNAQPALAGTGDVCDITKETKYSISKTLSEGKKMNIQDDINNFKKEYLEVSRQVFNNGSDVFFRSLLSDLADKQPTVEFINEKIASLGITEAQLVDLESMLQSEFGEAWFENITTYLSCLAMEDLWRIKGDFYKPREKFGFYTFNDELISYFIRLGFFYGVDTSIYKAFTMQKVENGSIQILGLSDGKMEVIGEFTQNDMKIKEEKASEILEYILRFKEVSNESYTYLNTFESRIKQSEHMQNFTCSNLAGEPKISIAEEQYKDSMQFMFLSNLDIFNACIDDKTKLSKFLSKITGKFGENWYYTFGAYMFALNAQNALAIDCFDPNNLWDLSGYHSIFVRMGFNTIEDFEDFDKFGLKILENGTYQLLSVKDNTKIIIAELSKEDLLNNIETGREIMKYGFNYKGMYSN